MTSLSRDDARRRQLHRRLIVVGLATVAAAFIGVEIMVQRSAALPLVVSNILLLHAITVVNILLVLVLLFVLGRNLVKLYVDRRHGKLGSKFQTKLMVTYVGLAMVPTVTLFIVGSDFIDMSVDRWFSRDVTEINSQARELVQQAYALQEGQLLDLARGIAGDITDERLVTTSAWALLDRNLKRLVDGERFTVDAAVFYSETERPRSTIVPPNSLLAENEAELELPATQILLAKSGQAFPLRVELPDGTVLIQACVPVFAPTGQAVDGVLVLSRLVDPALTQRAGAIQQLYADYAQGAMERGPIGNAYQLTFLLLSLLIIFGAVWIGLYLARGVTVPIQRLSEATRAVAAGDLEHRVEATTNDELGMLIDSFNGMTEDLLFGQTKLEQSRCDLEKTVAELDERRSYMESVLANIAAGVVSMNAAGAITTFNRAAGEMLGKEASEAVGRSHEEVLSGENFAELRTLMRHAGPRVAGLDEELSVEVGGQRLTIAAHCSSLRDSGGAYQGTVVVLEDLTGMIRAQKAAAWREVARRIAHEIRNPLTPIQLSAQRIARRYRKAAGAEAEHAVIEEGTRTILQEVDSLKGLVEEFSRFARMPSAKPVEADLHGIVADSLLPYPELYPEIEIVRELAASLPRLHVDPEQMRRAFTNLYDNAAKAMEGRGRLSVRTAYDNDLEVVRIEVADNGPGIAPEDKDRLFVPYFSRKRDGTGLGLAIVRQIIADHRGYVRVVDNVPRGATFVIELPVNRAY